MGFLIDIFTNKAMIVPGAAWLIAQLLKVANSLIFERRINLSRLVGSGGMPSSHSCYVIALATVIGKNIGCDSVEFGLACAFSFIVMYDATGVRQAAGKQAKLLNSLISTHFPGDEFNEKLKELLGHKPLEVFVGAVLGIIIGVLLG
ncbi:MAG: divergent PAP2 family protein [Oscillospiraceae bacterium]|nr:divergent PAP2 family protein [Oscillospiraceae bacterium]